MDMHIRSCTLQIRPQLSEILAVHVISSQMSVMSARWDSFELACAVCSLFSSSEKYNYRDQTVYCCTCTQFTYTMNAHIYVCIYLCIYALADTFLCMLQRIRTSCKDTATAHAIRQLRLKRHRT